MAITKFESYYKKICQQLALIRENNAYPSDSIAFAHWYLENQFKLNEQQIAESIIDGEDDLGIDAVVLDEENETLNIFQFKFPSKAERINSEIDQGDILKTMNGFNTLVGNDYNYSGKNQKFHDFKEQIRDVMITQFRIFFVSYNKGIVAKSNQAVVNSTVEHFRDQTGSNLAVEYHNRDTIANIFERMNRNNNIKITLKYRQMQTAYNVEDRKIESFVGFVSGEDLISAVSKSMATIFDENIRLYERSSGVNSGITRTATSTDQSDMFYFYNNGIVFICDKARNSLASTQIALEGASVVNGCQTLNVLFDNRDRIRGDVYILVRIIVISDYSERMRITEFLNSQTPIRDSYFIANHPSVRELQEKLIDKGYFLERQANEYNYKKEHGNVANALHVVQLEDIIQYYVGFWDNQNAGLAKRGKNALFDKSRIEDILGEISADKVIRAYNVYHMIREVLTLYRKTRRNPSKEEFADYIGFSQTELLLHIDDFRFMNTADIILMNAFANLERKYRELGLERISDKELIVESIFIVRRAVLDEQKKENVSFLNTASFTKNSTSFRRIQEGISMLSKRYVVSF